MSINVKGKVLKIPEKCLKCGVSYHENSVDTLSEDGNFFVFHLTCKACSTSVLFHVVFGQEGVLSVATLTDAGKEDLDKLKQGRMITTDELIEAYQEMKG